MSATKARAKEPERRARNGQGTVYQRPNGKYQTQVTVGRKPDGSLVRVTLTADTEAEVAVKRAQLIADHSRGLLSPPERTTVAEQMERWLSTKARREENSRTVYADVVRLHIVPHVGHLRVQKLTRADVMGLERALAAARKKPKKGLPEGTPGEPLSASTRAKALMYLRSALDLAIAEERLARNVARGVQVVSGVGESEPKGPKALTADEMHAFLRVAEDPDGSGRPDPLLAYLYTLFSLGLRRGEGLGIRWADVDLERRTLRLAQQVKRQKGGAVVGALKTKRSRRDLHLSEDLAAVLGAHRERQAQDRADAAEVWTETGLVFTTALGTLIQPDNVNRTIERLRVKAGVRHFSSHACRNTMSTLMLRGGVQLEVVSAILGHARPSITSDYYRSVFDDEKREATFSVAQARGRLQRPQA